MDDGRVSFGRPLAPTCLALVRRFIQLLRCVRVVRFGYQITVDAG